MVSLVNEGSTVKVPLRDLCRCAYLCVQSVYNPAGEVGEVKGGLMSPTHKPRLTQLGFKDLCSKKEIVLSSKRASTHVDLCTHEIHTQVQFQRSDKTDRKKRVLN